MKSPARPPIATAPDLVDQFRRQPSERGRLEREFEVRGELGHGGMGTVFSARDLRLCREVAVKVLSPDLRLDRGSTRRFVLEAQIAAQLEHPNILPFYALSCDESGHPGIVMRLVEGESFREYLDACAAGPEAGLTESRDLASRLERFLKACDAVEYAHARGVVHRDLKPENVMLGAHNQIYVVDWGLATVMHPDEALDEEQASLTAGGTTVGTPAYMAPEQARGRRDAVGPWSDQYTLGLMLQEIATLKPSRRGVTGGAAIRVAAQNEREPFTHRFGHPLPRSLAAIVAKATSTRPQMRYGSVAELARDIRRFARGDEVEALPDPPLARLWRRLRKRPGLVLGTLSSLALIASLATTVALARELGARARADRQAQRLASLTARVAEAAEGIEARVARIDLVLEGLATAATASLEYPPTLPDARRSPVAIAADPTTAFLARYRQRVTFERTAMVIAPGARVDESLLARSGDFERLISHAVARAVEDDEALPPDPAAQEAVAHDQSLIRWADLAFDEGVVFVYPGSAIYPEGYDVRKRSWYTLVVGARGRRWGSPYPEASTGQLVVPCSLPMFDTSGRFIGVAAVHLPLDELLSRLAPDGLAGLRESAVLDDHGDVVFSTGDRGHILGAGVHDNRALERRPFQIGEVRAAVAGGARDGSVRTGDAIVVYHRLESFNWTVAVTVAAASYSGE